MSRTPLVLLIVFLLPTLALAQAPSNPITRPAPPVVIEPDGQPITRPPALIIDDDGNKRPLVVEKVEVGVVIRGLLAETTMTLTFGNPHNRVLEGELFFPLPEGATVSGYGLDVGGKLVEGVIVEKHQARIAFEKEVRRGVDPGLVEWVRGNNFRTRVYPIPAQGRRTVMVRYVSNLVGTSEQAIYVLPLDFTDPVGQFDLEVQIVRGASKPTVTGGLSNFEFEAWEDRQIGKASAKDVSLTEDLRIALPQLPAQLVTVELDGNDAFFVVHDAPEIPVRRSRGLAPERIRLYWDASASRLNADRRPELDLLAKLVETWKRIEIDVVPFRDRLDRVTQFAIEDGDPGQLISFLEQLAYDGGTDLAAVDLTEPPGASYDLNLLVTDGLGNLGKVPELNGGGLLFTVSADSGADHALLRHLATSLGGAHVNLTTISLDAALSLFDQTPFAFLGADYDATQIAALHPSAWQPVSGRVHISGRLLADTATIVLKYGFGSEVTREVPITLRRTDASTTGLAARFWAQQEVASMAVLPTVDSAAMLALGQRYGIVTPGASLLVLETLQQHIEHDVQPPASRPELLAGWQRQRQQLAKTARKDRASKLEEVVVMWQTRVAWWETDFSAWRVKLKANATSTSVDRENGEEVRIEHSMVDRHSIDRYLEYSRIAAAPVSSAFYESEALASDSDISGAANRASEPAAGDGRSADITLQAWDPKTPYLANLKAAAKGRSYRVYLDQRAGYAHSPAYYLDCAGFFYQQGDLILGRRVLSSILELEIDDPALLRVVAYRLAETDDLDLAVKILEDVLELRPEEPQSARDLALMLARRAEDPARRAADPKRAIADFERAAELLLVVVMGSWDRFAEIEVIALMELNRLFAVIDRLPAGMRSRIDLPELDKRLRKLLDVDVRISMVWDADLTDVDLWIIEPTGEKAYYANNRTAIGGLVSRDFTQGYGPEEYVLRRAIDGDYVIKAHFYGSSQQRLLGAATIKAVVWTDWGRPNEQRQELTLRVDKGGDVVNVGTIALQGSK